MTLITIRKTTFIKTKLRIYRMFYRKQEWQHSDAHTNIDKYRLAANITEHHYIKINLTTNRYYKLLWSSESFGVKYNNGFEIPIKFQNKEEKY